MKDIIIFTSNKIEKESCLLNLKEKIKNIKENGNDLMIDSKNRLYLNFSSQRLTDSRDESSLDFQKMIPLDNPYLTFVETYRTKEAKIVVEILLSIYKDMYIYIDDIDWCGKATDFINTGFGF